MTRPLPARPNLEHLKKQAKELLRLVRANQPDASASFTSFGFASYRHRRSLRCSLKDAQRVIASEYGFPDWRTLKEHVEKQRSFNLPPDTEERIETFVAAAQEADMDKVIWLLEQDPNLLAGRNQEGVTAIEALATRPPVKEMDPERRSIYELLKSHGAVPDIRVATMAGDIGAVKSILEANPRRAT